MGYPAGWNRMPVTRKVEIIAAKLYDEPTVAALTPEPEVEVEAEAEAAKTAPKPRATKATKKE